MPIDQLKIRDAVRLLLEGLGCPPEDHNFDKTPGRVAKAYAELFAPADTEWPVFDEDFTDMVVLRGYEFYTLCPHHLFPVKLRACVAYIPNGKVLGASKLARVCNDANRYPKTQEALTNDIVERLDELLEGNASGIAIQLEGWHGCFSIRGIKAHAASMVTTKLKGQFLTDRIQEERFLRLAERAS